MVPLYMLMSSGFYINYCKYCCKTIDIWKYTGMAPIKKMY